MATRTSRLIVALTDHVSGPAARAVGNAFAGFNTTMGISFDQMERFADLINTLADAGISDGRYPLVAVVQGYIQYRNDRREKMAQAISSPLSEAKLAAIERRMKREDKHLIAMDEALSAYDTAASIYIESLRSLPAQITRDRAERTRLAAIVEIDVNRLKREFALGRHRLATGQDDPIAEDDE